MIGTNNITVIGLGPMGQAMAHVFLDNGLHVTVWNRTPSRADALAARGAIRAATPAEALGAGELVILSLTDYKAMYDILGNAGSALAGKVLVNLSSDTPESARKATQWAASHGASFLAGGVMVPPPMVGKPGAFTFFSGPEAVFKAHQPVLRLIGETDYRGEDPGLAQLYYQSLLDIMFTSVAGILHAMALMRSANISAKTFEPYLMQFMGFLPELLQGMADEVDAGQYNGELNNMIMMAAGMDHITQASKDAGINTSLPGMIKALYDQTVAEGHGKDGLSSVFEVLKKP